MRNKILVNMGSIYVLIVESCARISLMVDLIQVVFVTLVFYLGLQIFCMYFKSLCMKVGKPNT